MLRRNMNMSTKWLQFACLMMGLALMLISGSHVAAQTMTSTNELKLACETSPGNVVVLNQNTQISNGVRPPFTESVNTGCTIVINPQVTFEADQVSMTFNGPLRILGATEGNALFVESTFSARSVMVDLADKGTVLLDRSLVRASAGSVTLNADTEGVVDIRGPLVGGNVVASGAINLQGGQKFAAHLMDAEVRAGAGLNVTLTGAEAQFVATTSTLDANGLINVSATGDKGFVEFKLGSVATGRGGLRVVLTGNESVLNATQFAFNSGPGAATLQVNGAQGNLNLDDGTLTSGPGRAVTIGSSTTSTGGKATVQKAQINAGGSLRIETGNFGTTEVKDSSLTSPTLARIASGPGGTCISLNNIITAPVQQICP